MEGEGSVCVVNVFCPANDRNVPILLRHHRAELGSLGRFGPGEPLFCLDYGFRCSGWLCPHFAAPDFPETVLLESALEDELRSGQIGTDNRQAVLERALRENGTAEASARLDHP